MYLLCYLSTGIICLFFKVILEKNERKNRKSILIVFFERVLLILFI